MLLSHICRSGSAASIASTRMAKIVLFRRPARVPAVLDEAMVAVAIYSPIRLPKRPCGRMSKITKSARKKVMVDHTGPTI
jgi:hypothetical protein